MNHYVLTRSAFGPAWDIDANRRRLAVTRAVTVPLMEAQTTKDWTWVVLLDDRDPLLEERRAVFSAAAPEFMAIVWRPPLDRQRGKERQRAAAADYKAPWRAGIPADDTVLTTRIDDDDGFAPDALERFQRKAEGITKRTALMIPNGIRVWQGRYSDVVHKVNAMHTLVTPPGNTACVYDYSHVKVKRFQPVLTVDEAPGWLWYRHVDTISGWKKADHPLTPAIRSLFPIDWRALV